MSVVDGMASWMTILLNTKQVVSASIIVYSRECKSTTSSDLGPSEGSPNSLRMILKVTTVVLGYDRLCFMSHGCVTFLLEDVRVDDQEDPNRSKMCTLRINDDQESGR